MEIPRMGRLTQIVIAVACLSFTSYVNVLTLYFFASVLSVSVSLVIIVILARDELLLLSPVITTLSLIYDVSFVILWTIVAIWSAVASAQCVDLESQGLPMMDRCYPTHNIIAMTFFAFILWLTYAMTAFQSTQNYFDLRNNSQKKVDAENTPLQAKGPSPV